MAETGAATRFLARRAARRMLGRGAHLLDQTFEGAPVAALNGHYLALRTGSDPHFRLLVKCPTCQRTLVARSVKIRSPEDLDDALQALELAWPTCPVCLPR